MKNKKGFTLIELLAVIVILAIIALIAVPIVLNMIEQARKSAARSAALGYVDAIEYNNGFANAEMDGYTSITGEKEVEEIDVKMKGKKPDSGNVTIDSNGKVTHAEICINGYNVEYDGKDATVGDKCSGSSIPGPVSFATDSWVTINKAVKNNNISSYNVKDEKTIEMDVDGDGTNETYHIMIVNTTACTTETSETACGLVLQFKDALNVTNVMNNTETNIGGWKDSYLRTYLNTTIYNKLPSDLKNIIKTTKVISGCEQGATSNYETDDKLYLLSTKEVGFNTNSYQDKSLSTDTRTLDYYLDSNNSKKRYYYGTNTQHMWWLRTAATIYDYYNDQNKYFFGVSPDGGSALYTASNYNLIIPAFRIGK